MWSLATAKRVIIVAGCLGTAYIQLTLSPATIAYATTLGGDGFHVGLLGAIPTGTLFIQFLSAAVVNRVRYRRRLWMTISIAQRLLYVPMAMGPWLFPEVAPSVWLWSLIGTATVTHLMMHFGTPLWMSWMGDYLPHAGLSHYWGVRHLWTQWAAAASLFASAWVLLRLGLDTTEAFALLTLVGALAGVADVLLFCKISEPPVVSSEALWLRDVLCEPFRNPEYRAFISFSSFWNVASQIGAPFISLFLLDYLGMDLYHVLLLWTVSWVGGAVFAGRMGKMAEIHGHRPLLILCTIFKSLIMVGLLVVPRDPEIVFWMLVPVFMIDALLNSGMQVASHGYMLKNSPARNRTTYIAAGTAVAGTIGGVASVLAGIWMKQNESWHVSIGGTIWNHYHLVFLASTILRLVAIEWSRRLQEPRSAPTPFVVLHMMHQARRRTRRAVIRIARIGAWPEPSRPATTIPVTTRRAA